MVRLTLQNYLRKTRRGLSRAARRPLAMCQRLAARWRSYDRRFGIWWRLGNGAAAVLLLVAVVIPVLQQVLQSGDYRLSAEARQLVGQTDQTLTRQLSYNSQTATYQFNKDAIKPDNPLSKLQAQVGTASGRGADKSLYALDVPVALDKGVTYHDVNSSLSFRLIPDFRAGAGKTVQGHLVYPLAGGSQAVYTLKNNGLKEDVVVPRATSDTLTFGYRLALPKTLQAKVIPDSNGAIGIYSADPSLFGNISYGSGTDQAAVEKARENGPKTNLVFGLPSPVIKDAHGEVSSGALARFQLAGDHLSVVASGLRSISGSFTIDPSVVVTASSDFQTAGNNDSNIDFSTAGQVTRAAQTGGSTSSWSSTTSFSTARDAFGSVVYNGYLYVLGGTSTGYLNDVQYAPLHSNGSIGSWSTTTSFTTGRTGLQAVAYNGYLYVMGGLDSSFGFHSDVQYAPINADGTLGDWSSTSSFTTGRFSFAATAYNGYVYIMGGLDGSFGAHSDVQYAPINADGTLGDWSSTSSFSGGRNGLQTTAYNGYLYMLGGVSSGSYLNDVQYAKINANGTLGSWSTTTSFTNGRYGLAVASYGGYLYLLGGTNDTTSYNDVQYAPINGSGTIGSWSSTASFATARDYFGGLVSNGHLYVLGGIQADNDTACNATTSSLCSDVQYATINPAGTLQAFGSGGASFATKRIGPAVVASGGYLYLLGGSNNGSSYYNDVQYAKINANGTVGSWATTTSFSTGRLYAGAVASGGYLYVFGGYSGSAELSDVQYAPLNANGTVGSWQTTASFTTGRCRFGYATYNGYLYIAGGTSNSACSTTGNQMLNDVQYVAMSSNGALGTWKTAPNIISGRLGLSAQTWGGRLYVLGGYDGSSYYNDVQYATINGDGSLGSWTQQTNAFTTGRQRFGASIADGVLYITGGSTTGGVVGDTQMLALRSDGSVGPAVSTSTLGARASMGTISYNGYLYVLGGIDDGGTLYNDVQSAAINNGGSGAAGTFTTSSSNFALARHNFQTVSYNGYLYVLGGVVSGNSNSVQYAPLNADGSIGTWKAATNLSTARSDFAAAAYNGYIYVLGGSTGSGTGYTRTIQYAPLNADGSIGTWKAATNLFAAGRNGATAAAYNGYLYIMGGQNSSGSNIANVQYAPLNADGSIGSWTATTAFTTGRYEPASVAYGGYLYLLGGVNPSSGTVNSVQYAPIGSNGSLGAWAATNAFSTSRAYLGAAAYNGYLYVLGGGDFGGGYSDVQSAPISSNGALGSWSPTSSLTTSRMYAGAAIYNGYLYAVGGNNGSDLTTTDYAPLSSSPRSARYSRLVDLGSLVRLASITYNGVVPGTAVTYRAAGADGVFGGSAPVSGAGGGSVCNSTTRYVWLAATLDDSFGQAASGAFPDSAAQANLTDITVNYTTVHPQPNIRLRGGQTLQNGSLSPFDTCS